MEKKQKLKKLKAALGGEAEENQQEPNAETNKRLDLLIGSVKELTDEVRNSKTEYPEQIEVKNLSDIPSEVEIKNFPEVQQVEITNLPDPVEPPEVQKVEVVNELQNVRVINPTKAPEVQKVEITNHPKPKPDVAPSWLNGYVQSFLEGLATILEKVTKRTFTIQYAKGERQKPQLVVLVDPHTGKAYGQKETIVQVTGGYGGGAGGGSGSGGYETVFLKDIAGSQINPAKDDTLLDILTQLEAINSNTDTIEITAENVNLNTDTLEAKLQSILTAVDGLETQFTTALAELSGISGFSATAATENTLASLVAYLDSIDLTTQAVQSTVADISNNTDGLETLLTLISNAQNSGKQVLKKTITLSASGTVHTPASGKKIRLLSYKFSLDANLTHVALRFASGGTDFAKFLAPKAGGYYGDNMHPDYNEGSVDQVLHADISGTGNVQINITYLEI